MRAKLWAVGVACTLAGLAGCGNSRTQVPSSSTPATPNGVQKLSFRSQGLSLLAPTNWDVTTGHGRLVTVLSSGDAVVALWRYPVSAPQPSGAAALRQTERKLVRQVRARDPGLKLISTSITRIGGVPAVQLDALEQIAGHPRRVSSSHLFAPRAEVVLDAYAPPGLFVGVNRTVFAPIRRSLLVVRDDGATHP